MQLGFVVVRGRSMEPTYLDGDVLLVGYGLAPRVGRCHVVRLPDADDGPRPLAVKRVTREESTERASAGEPAGEREAHPANAWWVERDNPREGVDSWLVGALDDDAMLARVLAPNSPGMARRMRRCRTWAATFRRRVARR